MSDDNQQTSDWDMPIRILILLVVAGGTWLGFNHFKPKPAPPPPPEQPSVVHNVAPLTEKLESWTAGNNAATTMTGDIQASSTTLVLRKQSFQIAPTHTLDHTELLSAGNFFLTSAPEGSAGTLYQTNIPASFKLLDKSAMCGAEPAQWVLALITLDYNAGVETLNLGYFSGATPPPLGLSALPSAPGVCAKFTYAHKIQ